MGRRGAQYPRLQKIPHPWVDFQSSITHRIGRVSVVMTAALESSRRGLSLNVPLNAGTVVVKELLVIENRSNGWGVSVSAYRTQETSATKYIVGEYLCD